MFAFIQKQYPENFNIQHDQFNSTHEASKQIRSSDENSIIETLTSQS